MNGLAINQPHCYALFRMQDKNQLAFCAWISKWIKSHTEYYKAQIFLCAKKISLDL